MVPKLLFLLITKIYIMSAKKVVFFPCNAYIYNWPLQFFSQDYGLASHSTRVVCLNFIHELQNLQLNVDSEHLGNFLGNFFRKLFHGRFMDSQSFWPKSAERKSSKKYFHFYILFSCHGLLIGLRRLLSILSRLLA